MKRIAIINQDSGYLVVDIVNELCKSEADIALVAGRVVARNKPLDSSVEYRKIIKYHRSNKLYRLFSWIIAFIQIVLLVKTKLRNDYLFIFTNPPLATLIPLLTKSPFSLMIYDIYPDILTQMRLLSENSALTRFWKKKNRTIYSKADNIFTLTESMATELKKYCGEKQVNVVPIWSDGSFFKPVSRKENSFILENNLVDRFVVMYSGNLGATHNVEIFTEIAQRIKNTRIILLIIGGGDQKRTLEEKVRKLNISNCLLLPLQPVDRIPYSFSAADLAIVSLNTNATGMSLPSKTFSYMSAGLPLLCIAGEDSELKSLVTRHNNGRCFTPDKLDEIAAFIEELEQDNELLKSFQTNSLSASLNFTDKNAGLIAEGLLKSINE